ncbi:SMP-30/gluconolactonase/LRE family protein [Pandoraea nosoerga]|uniref:Gluconolactonase n=1 Tax=Pandoraea nosoerga TaxID=2508296 RepID=A0A5E4VN51_9BURK|nr:MULTISPECIES: SMP-30/gluconolactonase/LRE family protein [Pandoraea]MBN4666807.1 SMP-30/gluconolactonase/LRE family protein [Pandoraea nosoerga]MBN4677542.1 SMP-30/gluconolactonase/LRE family protein [Pandoraea nosoerga]MBN4682408.1 SMP-30/gluconolactonase/LRE family protein [Pandoraea nosoerga]MBN4746078.1 SMP-30/gluconolactonase/LRE family protein [Pandoraea nosoerga]VVE13343.1 gluconolactonase [Pandoraea nosoerga]
MSVSIERLEPSRPTPHAVGESPLWRADEQALYWVDIPARQLHRVTPADGEHRQWTFPEQVACFSFDVSGTLLVGAETGLFAAKLGADANVTAAQWRRLAAPAFPAAGMRFNDGRCDRQGRFWAGTMVQDMSLASDAGSLFCFDAQGQLSAPLVDGLVTQNGLAFSPDSRTMYLSDSHPTRRRVWAYDFDAASGAISARRLFVDMNRYPGRPDGAAVDAHGCYWTCANDGGRLLRFTPRGDLDREILLPVSKPSMCAFGGREFDTLFVTSIRPGANATDQDGHVFAVRCGVKGLPETPYAGTLPAALV